MEGSYDELEEVGHGAHGMVWRAVPRAGGAPVAIKRANGLSAEFAEQEIVSLKKMRGAAHVVQLVEVIAPNIIVMEYIPTTLAHLIKARALADEEILTYSVQLLRGLKECHDRGVIHRDIKPQNMLVDEGAATLKIADFGLSCAVNDEEARSICVGSLWYRAPEKLLGEDWNAETMDIWAAGCVLMQMSVGLPFCGYNDLDQLLRVFWVMGTPTKADWPNVVYTPFWSDLLPKWSSSTAWSDAIRPELIKTAVRNMVVYDPQKRWGTERLLATF
jgi:serine/threonine protein kinase